MRHPTAYLKMNLAALSGHAYDLYPHVKNAPADRFFFLGGGINVPLLNGPLFVFGSRGLTDLWICQCAAQPFGSGLMSCAVPSAAVSEPGITTISLHRADITPISSMHVYHLADDDCPQLKK